MNCTHFCYKKIRRKGFSVAELIVVIGIFALMTTVSMFKYNDHMDQIRTTDLAQDIALTLRQAQVYGISASDSTIAAENFYDDGNTVEDQFFDADSGTVKNITQDRSIRGASFYLADKKIVIFEDINRDHLYKEGADRMIDEREITYHDIDFSTFMLCDATDHCEEGSGRVDITFERPYPDATIYHVENPDSTSGAVKFDKAIIHVRSGEQDKIVEINSIGNIAVK